MGYASSFIQLWRTAGVLLVFPAGNKLSSGTPGWPKGGFHGLNSALHKAWVELQVCAQSSAQTASPFHRDLHELRVSLGGFHTVPKLGWSFPWLTREPGITSCSVKSMGQKPPLEIHREQKPLLNWNKNKAVFEKGMVSPFHIVHCFSVYFPL